PRRRGRAVLRCGRMVPSSARQRTASRRQGGAATTASAENEPSGQAGAPSPAENVAGQAPTTPPSLLPARPPRPASKGFHSLLTENFTIQSRPNQPETSRDSGGLLSAMRRATSIQASSTVSSVTRTNGILAATDAASSSSWSPTLTTT